VEAENWLREKRHHQDTLPKYASPVLLSADIRKKAEAVDRYLLFVHKIFVSLLCVAFVS